MPQMLPPQYTQQTMMQPPPAQMPVQQYAPQQPMPTPQQPMPTPQYVQQVAAPPLQMPVQQYAPQQYVQQYAPQQYAPQQYAPQQYAPQQYAPQQHAPQQYAPQQYAPQIEYETQMVMETREVKIQVPRVVMEDVEVSYQVTEGQHAANTKYLQLYLQLSPPYVFQTSLLWFYIVD
jgi:hypothetical protein